jgi:hypothetical protein
MKKETKKTWFLAIAFVLGMVSVVFGADSTSYMANVMAYGKWVVSVIAGLVTLSAAGTLMWGYHLKDIGDMRGDAMVKNSFTTLIICGVCWALIGAFLFKGAELNTGAAGITEGWK